MTNEENIPFLDWTQFSEQRQIAFEAQGSPLLVCSHNCTSFLGDFRAAHISTRDSTDTVSKWVLACSLSTGVTPDVRCLVHNNVSNSREEELLQITTLFGPKQAWKQRSYCTENSRDHTIVLIMYFKNVWKIHHNFPKMWRFWITF